jgi:hypothetical protein
MTAATRQARRRRRVKRKESCFHFDMKGNDLTHLLVLGGLLAEDDIDDGVKVRAALRRQLENLYEWHKLVTRDYPLCARCPIRRQ